MSDRSDAYLHLGPAGENCFASQRDWTVRTCIYGDPRSKTNVAFVGNSHAGQWLPALEGAARRHHWRVTAYLVSRCVFAETLQVFGGQGCLRWTTAVEEQLLGGHFSLIVLLNSLNVQAVGASFDGRIPLYEKGYEAVLRKLAAIHARVVGVRDNPIPHFDVPACLAAHPNDYLACSGLRSRWVNPEPLFTAMNRIHDPRFVQADLTNYFCGPFRCDAAVGGVTVYLDRTHPTATFAGTLTPYLDPFLVRALKTP